MSIQEGLLSSDPEVIKLGRRTAKGKVSSKVNYLKNLLESESEDLIDGDEMRQKLQDIEDNLELFQQLHEHFLENRITLKDKTAEVNFIQEQDNYQDEVIKKVCAIKSVCKLRLNKIEAGIKNCCFGSSQSQAWLHKTGR